MSKGIPVPDAKWTVPVDADGNPIAGRALREGDFLARPPIVLSPVQTLSFDDERPHEIQSAENTLLFNQAVFDLSQSRGGRRLLKLARDNNMVFAFDPVAVREKGADALNGGLKGITRLNTGRLCSSLQLSLKHELQHVEDWIAGLFYESNDTTETATKILRAQEANARLSEAVHVYECEIDQPGDNSHRYKPKSLKEAFHANVPTIAEIIENKAAPYARHGDWKRFAQIGFDAFYKDGRSIDFYDEAIPRQYLNWFEEETGPTRDDNGFMSIRTRLGHKEIAAIINLNGIYFLQGCDYCLDDAAHITRSESGEVQTYYAALKEKIAALGPTHPCHPVIDWEPREAHDRILMRGKSNITSTDGILPEAALPAVLGRPATPQRAGASIAA